MSVCSVDVSNYIRIKLDYKDYLHNPATFDCALQYLSSRSATASGLKPSQEASRVDRRLLSIYAVHLKVGLIADEANRQRVAGTGDPLIESISRIGRFTTSFVASTPQKRLALTSVRAFFISAVNPVHGSN